MNEQFCTSCNQYGCHLSTCDTFSHKYQQARSDYEVMRMENFSLMNDIRVLKARIIELEDEVQEWKWNSMGEDL